MKWNEGGQFVPTELFRALGPESLSIETSAANMGVSTATIRNWIKTGYLTPATKGRVTTASLQWFQTEIAGKEKLHQRANKSHKNEYDHKEVVSDFLTLSDKNFQELDTLGNIYEKSLADAHRDREGIYYTPPYIVDKLFTIDLSAGKNVTFCDPCCGSGNFVVRALALGFQPQNIFAYDTDPIAVKITKKRILQLTGYESRNILTTDFLQKNIGKNAKYAKYDFIFTNPPCGKKISRKERAEIGKKLQAGASIDTCSLFFFACLNALNDNGKLGLLLPEAFFNISTFASARISALKYKIENLSDWGKPFPGLLTRAQSLVLTKRKSESTDLVLCNDGSRSAKRSYLSFAGNPKAILNLRCSQEEAETLTHILAIPHLNLKDNARWGLGIVTGNNKRFINDKPAEGLLPVYRGSDISSSGIRAASCFIPADLTLYQQVAPMEIYKAKEKIIYKFISSKLCFCYDDRQRFLLNSANILIPDKNFALGIKLLCALLNSDFMNWLFSRLFNTHKVLRTDIESLPIHAQFLNSENFIESEFISKLNIERSINGTFRIKK